MSADAGCVGHQAIFFHDADGFNACPHGQGVAPKGGAVVARLKNMGSLGARHNRTNRHPGTQALGQRHHVGNNACPLVGKPFSGATHATLHFVDHQKPVFLIAKRTHLFQVFNAHGVDAALALNGLHEHGHHIRVALSGFFQGLDVIHRDTQKTIQHGAKTLFELFVGGGAEGGNAAAMKGLFVNDNFGFFDAFVMAKLSSQFDGGFVGLQASAAKKHVGHTRQFHQFGRQHFGVGHMEIIATVDHLADLVLQCRDQFGVVVSQRVHCNARQRIQIGFAIDVPDSATLTMAECNRQSAIGVHGVRGGGFNVSRHA